ncbi:PREDICTED: acyl-CoA-binding domain-containing protein 4 isoform X2 [Tarenaya hassleriana]|uniref:acyl-CoA-binding domain-containing protein 4 isoform X2 n=1 Tax=Tarenaya hassleriana TaxID=28532 RepID=UPI00053C6E21|nr:PREDICTED: acyl-CoA-binding domain-containing protein 4 isoform X2 [Tarenaya hassleriana]
MRWERVRQQYPQVGLGESSAGPGKRWGHTCNAIKGGSLLYVFGGYGRDNCQTNLVHVFDTEKQIWTQPSIKGTPPAPRDSHSCTTVGDNLFVFGGTDGRNPLKDLHILDTSSHTWICPSVRGEGPEAREGHGATLVGKRLFVFGGCGKSSDTGDELYYNDLYILNTETFVWKRAVTTGNPPSARDSHTCSSWINKIIVIGGEDGHDYYLSDVHILDADTLVWKELNTSGQLLTPRAGHATVALGRNLFVFGGFTDAQNLYDDLYVLDVEACVWSRVLTMSEGPSARFSASGDCLDPHKSGMLVFVGGCNKNLEALDDMYYLCTGLGHDSRDDQSQGRLSLKKQLKLKCQEQSLADSLYDKALVTIDMGQGRENFPLNQSQFTHGKMTFQARVTESFPLGYTIETVIDGKMLRGVLFSNRQGSVLTADYSFSRKRGAVWNGDQGSGPKTSRTLSKDLTANPTKDDAIDSKDSPSNGMETGTDLSDRNKKVSPENPLGVNINTSAQHETERPATPVVENQVEQDASQLNMGPENTEPSSVPPNLNDEQTNEASDPRNGVSRDVGAAAAAMSVPADPSSKNQDERLASMEGGGSRVAAIDEELQQEQLQL